MAWTTPRTFVTGEIETAAIFNTHLRDNLNFLKNGVGVFTSVTANVGPTSGTTELVVASQAFTADGTTVVEVMFTWYSTTQTVTTDGFLMRLYDGPTAGSGTQISQATIPPSANTPTSIVRAIVTPSAGAHTYTARLFRLSGTGTSTLVATSGAVATISVGLFN